MTYFPLHQTTCFFIPLVAPCKPLLAFCYLTDAICISPICRDWKRFFQKTKKFLSQIPFSFSYLWAGIPFGKNGSISGIFLRIWLRFPPFASNVRNCCLRQWISYFILSMILFHRWKLIVDFVCLLAINLIWLLLTLLMIRIPIGGIILWNGMRKDITNFI